MTCSTAEYFKDFLKDAVNIDDTRLNKLESRVEAVYKALRADPVIGPVITGKSRQGSWAQLTIVRPKPDGEFDADFFLLMNEQPGWEPKDYLNAVYNALSQNPTYSKQKHGRKCRCVWLEYAPENGVGCHLDIVPLITLANGRRVIVNRDNNAWEPDYGSTSPQGLTDWVKRRDQLTGGQYRRVVRLMKYLRNERGSFDGVKSVILTTVLGLQVTDARALVPGRYTKCADGARQHRRGSRQVASSSGAQALAIQPGRRRHELRPPLGRSYVSELPGQNPQHRSGDASRLRRA